MTSRLCAQPRCGRLCYARGLCTTHYYRLRRHSKLTVDDPIYEPFRPQDRPREPWCLCDEPVIGVIRLFARDNFYAERPPQHGDAVQCRTCQMPIKEWLHQ